MDKRIKSGVEWLLGAIDVDFVRLEEKVRDGLVYSRNAIQLRVSLNTQYNTHKHCRYIERAKVHQNEFSRLESIRY